MRLSAVIMAHPVRKREAEELQESLDRPVDIVYDTNPEPSKDPAQRWATGRRCWEAQDPSSDWSMVIQDDAIACPDLLAGLELALDQVGTDGLVSAYTGTGRPQQTHIHKALHHAQTRGHAWMTTRSLCWGVAIIVPTYTIEGMLRWCARPSRSTQHNYDLNVGRYYRDVLRWRTWYTVPSLVDHRDDVPSLVGHGAGRVAHMMCSTSALHVDWSRVPSNGLYINV